MKSYNTRLHIKANHDSGIKFFRIAILHELIDGEEILQELDVELGPGEEKSMVIPKVAGFSFFLSIETTYLLQPDNNEDE